MAPVWVGYALSNPWWLNDVMWGRLTYISLNPEKCWSIHGTSMGGVCVAQPMWLNEVMGEELILSPVSCQSDEVKGVESTLSPASRQSDEVMSGVCVLQPIVVIVEALPCCNVSDGNDDCPHFTPHIEPHTSAVDLLPAFPAGQSHQGQ